MSDKFVIEDTIEEITMHDGGRTKIGEIGGGDGRPYVRIVSWTGDHTEYDAIVHYGARYRVTIERLP